MQKAFPKITERLQSGTKKRPNKDSQKLNLTWEMIYKNAEGVPQNYEEATKWHQKAAEQGFAEAQFNLGVMYTNAEGVSQNYEEAAKWYLKAAEQGFTEAQFNLGMIYTNAQGVPQNHTRSRKVVPKGGRARVRKSSILPRVDVHKCSRRYSGL